MTFPRLALIVFTLACLHALGQQALPPAPPQAQSPATQQPASPATPAAPETKDDKPLSPKDAAKEEAKIQKIIDKRKNESESDRKKREEREIKDHEDSRKFETEVADAYNFKLVGTEPLGGREAWIIDAEPRPGFVPHMKEAKFLSKFRGRVWIDKADLQLAKLDVECLDTVSFGWFLARFHNGTRITLEQTRINDEVWLPLHVAAKIDVRVALLKNFDVELEQAYRDHKKFRSSSKIVGVAEVEDKSK
jgi:hypothetical protein